MYRKVITTNKKLIADKNSLNWLTASRSKIIFMGDHLKFKNEKIFYSDMKDVELLSYKSFFFFNLYSIFSFKYGNLYYQIGINNNESEIILNYFKDLNATKINFSSKDVIYLLVIITTSIYLIYIYLK